jgi:hypothetical protein
MQVGVVACGLDIHSERAGPNLNFALFNFSIFGLKKKNTSKPSSSNDASLASCLEHGSIALHYGSTTS